MNEINLNPGSVFLTVENEKGIVNAQTKNGGDINFVRYMLEELGDMVPGEPIPARLFVRYDMGEKRSEMPEIVFDDPNFYQHSFLPFIEKEGIPQAQSMLMADAAFCVAQDISLVDAAADNKLFINDSRYKDFWYNYLTCAPDIFSQIAALWDNMPPVTPGFLFAAFDKNLHVTDRELTQEFHGTKFTDFVQRQLDRLEPGHPLPLLLIARYTLDDITPLKDNPCADANLFVTHRLMPVMREQKCPPVEIFDTENIIYAIEHGLNPITTSASQFISMPDYQEERKRIGKSVPAGLKLKGTQQLKGMTDRQEVQHVPSLPEPKGKHGPKIF